MSLSRSSVPNTPLKELLSEKNSHSNSRKFESVTFPEESLKNVFGDRDSKLALRIAYQGAPGAYSEAAAMKVYPNCETIQFEQFEDAMKVLLLLWYVFLGIRRNKIFVLDLICVFKAAEQWKADRAVVPIENTVGGSVHRNYDLLLRHGGLHIVGETHVAVDHCLLGLPGVKIEELKHVFSHPQALDQCEMSLSRLGVRRVSCDNTAVAAKTVANKKVREHGAIASARAASVYGLDVLAHQFQDKSNNITRFFILAREPIIPANDMPYKTTIVFSLKEGPGTLVEALAVFALRRINLSKIESRPLQKHSLGALNGYKDGNNNYFDYFFFIDFEASIADPRAKYALQHLKEFKKFIRILGCYPMDKEA